VDQAAALDSSAVSGLVIRDANEAALAAHGFTREEIIGQPMSILDPFLDPGRLEERIAAIQTHGQALFQVKHRRKDGSLLDAEVRTTLMRLEGRPVLLASERDITERIKAEQERQALQAQLHQSQKLESLGSLAGGVAHDMNNVLGAILSLASTMKMRMAPSDPGADSLETIMQACTRGRGVVKSLLYFARKDLQEERVVDLNVLVQDMTNLLGYTILKRFTLETDLQADLGAVRCDEGTISNALMNLCVNSMDAMPEGGVLTLRTGARPDGGVELRVKDTGEGMAPEILAKAMDPFFTTKPVGKGTGLGLSMVFGTMRAHGGGFELRSQPGGGTEAILVFPASRVGRPEPARETQMEPASADRASLDILLVDDEELVRESVLIMLEAMGHRIVPVPGGQEALACLEQGAPVDLVVLDMNMPGLNGAETLRGILALRPALPVLIATGYSDEDVAALVEAHPNVLSLRKPFSPADVDDRIARLAAPLRGMP
jgi:PAS domain S-box-containing protein